MKVLVLNGSPKGERSNTYRLTGAFLDGLRQVQQAEVEVLEVGKLHLLPCRGCFACWSKTPGKCVLQDDMAGVIEKLLAADLLIWSFPLYYFCSSTMSYSKVNHVLHHFEEQFGTIRLRVVIRTAFGIDVCYLLVVSAL